MFLTVMATDAPEQTSMNQAAGQEVIKLKSLLCKRDFKTLMIVHKPCQVICHM